MEFSIYEDVFDTKGGETKTLSSIVTYIRTNQELKEKTDKARELLFSDQHEYKEFKKSEFYQFSPAGIFAVDNRNKEGLEVHSGIIIIDLDHLSASQLHRIKSIANTLPFTAMTFTSPSGEGFKIFALVSPIPTGFADHFAAHDQVAAAYKERFSKVGVNVDEDEQGRNLSRLCALSYDNDVYFNPIPASFQVTKADGKRQKLKPKPAKPEDCDLKSLEYISPDEYNIWLRVGMAIKDAGLTLQVWQQWSSSSPKYNETECNYKWSTFTESGVSWGTIIHLAKENGYEPKPQSGNGVKDRSGNRSGTKNERSKTKEKRNVASSPKESTDQESSNDSESDSGGEVNGLSEAFRERQEIQLIPEVGIVRTSEEVWDYVGTHQRHNPTIFRRGFDLVAVSEDTKGNMRFEEITDKWIKKYLDRIIVFKSVKKTSVTVDSKVVDDLPRKYVDAMLSSEGNYPDWIPSIRAVSPFPMLGKNDRILTKRGYDPDSEFYLSHSTDIDWDRLSIDRGSVAGAVGALLHCVVDFPFEDAESRTNWLAYLLSFPLRSYISQLGGVYPLYAVTAPVAGSGKTLLVSLCSLIWTGRKIYVTQIGQDGRNEGEEMRKRLLATLSEGQIIQVFDNIDTKISSGNLASAITSGEYKDRILGKSEMLSVAVEWILAVTGNHLEFGGDMPRRIFWTKLSAVHEKPENRTGFIHSNLEEYCLANRRMLVESCLIILKSWIELGKPKAHNLTFGSFQVWVDTLGGILQCAGVNDFLEKRDQDDSPEILAMREFTEVWYQNYEESHVTIKDLFPLASYYDSQSGVDSSINQGANILEEYIYGRTEDNRSKSFGKYLTRQLGRIFGAFKVSKHPRRINNTAVYYLEKMSND